MRRPLGAAAVLVLAVVLACCSQYSSPPRKSDPAEPVPGIAATARHPLPANAVVCAGPAAGAGHPVTAAVSDPAAPRATIAVPDGWSASAGTGDTALVLSGPDGMMAKVTIASTDLAPDTAFLRYIASEPLPRREFAVTGALLCGYSGQLLTGTLQSPAGDIDFADRIVHLWTNSKQYLVAIHVTGRSAGFAAAKAALTQDFAVVIP